MARSIILFFSFLCIARVGAFAENERFVEILNSIEERIQKGTEKIQEMEFLNDTSDEVLQLYNERAIIHFSRCDYQSALADFDHILKEKSLKNETEDPVFGAGLWGRVICHACLDMESACEGFQQLENYFRDVDSGNNCYSQKTLMSKVVTNSDSYIPIINFTNPNEIIGVEECKSRVKGTAHALRLFIAPLIPSTSKRAVFLSFILGLEDAGLDCCRYGTFWTTCVTPLLQKTQDWKILGIPADPYWD